MAFQQYQEHNERHHGLVFLTVPNKKHNFSNRYIMYSSASCGNISL
jgi:hypothetical protein